LEENSLLKTETLELSQRLHQLQQAITASQWAEDWGLLSPIKCWSKDPISTVF
jgi:hypothetical protein